MGPSCGLWPDHPQTQGQEPEEYLRIFGGMGYRLGDQWAGDREAPPGDHSWLSDAQSPHSEEQHLPSHPGSPKPQLTKWHDGNVFPPELAGDGDFLPEAPAMLREYVVGSRWGVVAHLGPDQLDMSIARHRPSQDAWLHPMSPRSEGRSLLLLVTLTQGRFPRKNSVLSGQAPCLWPSWACPAHGGCGMGEKPLPGSWETVG